MPTPIIMPKVDMVMETGTFVEWLMKEGETVERGQALFVISTDKAAIEVEAPASGILTGLCARPQESIPVSQVIGYIAQPGETLVSAAAPAPAAMPVSEPPALVRATPLARGLARELALDLRQIPGSGPRGRIYRADVERYAQTAPQTDPAPEPVRIPIPSRPTVPVSTSAPVALPLPHAREKGRAELQGPKQIIAERMAYASSIPHILFTVPVDMSAAATLRQKVNPVYQRALGVGVSYTAIIAHAVAQVLKKHPYLNSSFLDNTIYFWEDVHLGIATDLDDILVVPVIREAQNKKLAEMAQAIHTLAEKARARKLLPAEMSGSTFTISNLGMAGVASFTAIINPPETAILAVGKITDTPVVVDSAMVIRPMMNLTVAVDHRVTNGAQAARFLMDVKAVLETPYLLI